MLRVDLSTAGVHTVLGGRLLGPWFDWPVAAAPGRRLRLVRPHGCRVYSNDVGLAAELNRRGGVEIAASIERLQTLIVHTATTSTAVSSDSRPLGSLLSAARRSLEGALRFCAGLFGGSAPDVTLDILACRPGFDGLSIPGAVLLTRGALAPLDRLIVAHEAAHQWWGPQSTGNAAASLWTESIAEVIAIAYLERSEPERVRRAVRHALKLHFWLLSRPVLPLRRILAMPGQAPQRSALVEGTGVLLYLTRLAELGWARFVGLAVALAQPVAGWRDWLARVAPDLDPVSFAEAPVLATEALVRARRGWFRARFGPTAAEVSR